VVKILYIIFMKSFASGGPRPPDLRIVLPRKKILTTPLHFSAYHYRRDGDVISMPAGFRRHLVGKTPINVFHCDIAEKRFVVKTVIIQTFS